IGAGSDVTWPALNGTWDRMPPIGARVGGVLRLAPLGVPVVPLVRMMIEAFLVVFGAGALLLRAISSGRGSSVLPDGSSESGLVPNARSLPSSGSALLTALQYSSS